jgi:excisionase family DNA binding protein
MQGIVLDSISRDEFQNLIRECVREELRSQSQENPQSSSNEDELINSKEAASLLRISLPTLHKWKKQGRIPFHRIGTRIRFNKAEVLATIGGRKK